jgi:sec-independent protein translocase protein TatA
MATSHGRRRPGPPSTSLTLVVGEPKLPSGALARTSTSVSGNPANPARRTTMGGKLGLTEILLILAIALLLFGPSKLADLGKGLGEGIKNFKSAMKDGEEDKDKKS